MPGPPCTRQRGQGRGHPPKDPSHARALSPVPAPPSPAPHLCCLPVPHKQLALAVPAHEEARVPGEGHLAGIACGREGGRGEAGKVRRAGRWTKQGAAAGVPRRPIWAAGLQTAHRSSTATEQPAAASGCWECPGRASSCASLAGGGGDAPAVTCPLKVFFLLGFSLSAV